MALYGIYGQHTPERCPWNNEEIGNLVMNYPQDISKIGKKYKINKVVGQFHSALEHTFLWIVDAEDPHLLQNFADDTGAAKFNYLKFVPLITMNEVVEGAKKKWSN